MQHKHSKQCQLALCEHSKKGPVVPVATPTVSIGLDVGTKLSLLTDSVGLVSLAENKVVLLSVKEDTEGQCEAINSR